MRAPQPIILLFIVMLSGMPMLVHASTVWSSSLTHSDELRVYTPDLANPWFDGTATIPVTKIGVWNHPDFTTTASTTVNIWARWNGSYISILDVILRATSGGDPFYGSGSTTAEVATALPDSYYRLNASASSSLQEYVIPARQGETIHQGNEIWAFLYPSFAAYGANHWIGSNGLLPYFEICEGPCTSNDTPPPDPCAVPGACASNVLFLPGIKGSVLKVNNDTVWPPSFWSDDLLELAMTDDGESVNPVVVNGILETFHGTPIYSGFATFMDELVASGTTTQWKALPYDWRFSPERILADGVRTPAGIVDPIEEIETLAANSETGKVAIVAHSMGGLLGKAIIKKLQDEGKEGLIDSFVMIGTPQLGTPQAAASLLHGDGEGIWAGLIVNAAMARKIAQNFQSTYDLLPSSRYFSEVAEPVITFDPGAVFTQAWRDYWGPAIDTYTEFFSFITGGGVARLDPEFTQLWIPEILRADLAETARDFHDLYDSYAFPDSIRVVQVAGWGAPTVKAIKYKTRHFMQNYEPLFTREGDSTVVYPSAVSTNLAETYFLNLSLFNKNESKNIQHRDILSAMPIREVVKGVIERKSISEVDYISVTKPPLTELGTQLIISTHSPVILGVYDASGNFAGINPNQDLKADVLSITEDIPGSTFLSFGGSQYLFLPKDGSYNIAFKGTGSGPTDVDIESFSNDTAFLIATYSDISVTASTSATFIVSSTSPQDAHIQVDSNNDGQVDTYIAPDNQPLTLNELLTNLRTIIQNLAVKDKLKANLIKKVKNIEKKIAKQKNKNASKMAMNLEKQIIRKGTKGKLSDTDVAEIVRLLEQIENAL